MAGTFKVYADMRVLKELIATCKGTPTRILHDGVEYGVYNEFGTTRMSAHPFITPAVEGVRNDFMKGLGQLANLKQADSFVEIIGRKAEALAKDLVRVDTGALKNSIRIDKPEDFSA